MQLTARQRYSARIYLWVLGISLVVGATYGHAVAPPGAAGGGYVHGALTSLLVACPIVAMEALLFNERYFRRFPFLAFLALRSLGYLGAIVFGSFAAAWLLGDLPPDVSPIDRRGLLFSACVAIAFNVLLGVNRLLGPGVFLRFAVGRYHRPRIEERIVLFLDMESSTAIAERLGETGFFDFLNRFVADLSGPIADHGGEIHKYVGDEVIATWPLKPGLADARAIAACFDALAALEAQSAGYERDFGRRANFRAALHCGPVVVGELGVIKQEIALLGDTMNTTARLQEACRTTGHRVLASAALVERLATLPPGIAKRTIGRVQLRGREGETELYALSMANATEAVASPVALA